MLQRLDHIVVVVRELAEASVDYALLSDDDGSEAERIRNQGLVVMGPSGLAGLTRMARRLLGARYRTSPRLSP